MKQRHEKKRVGIRTAALDVRAFIYEFGGDTNILSMRKSNDYYETKFTVGAELNGVQRGNEFILFFQTLPSSRLGPSPLLIPVRQMS